MQTGDWTLSTGYLATTMRQNFDLWNANFQMRPSRTQPGGVGSVRANDSNRFLNEEWFHSYFCFLLGLRVVWILLVQCCARPSGKWRECPLEVESLQKGSCRPHVFFFVQQSRMNWRLCCGTLLCIPLWTLKPRCTPWSCCGLIWMKCGVTSFRLASQYR